MRERASNLLPFAIAVVLPPAGLLLGLITAQEDRDLGLWICAVVLLAGVIWAVIVLAVA